MQKILQGISYFQNEIYPGQRGLFRKLAQGQKPEALFIGCSDSRIALDLITQTGPGDLFVCRNAGNMVPAHGEPDAVSAAIEYAIGALGIRHIVICGHSDCGAMKGVLHPEALTEMPTVAHWLRHAAGARRAVGDTAAPDALPRLTRLNVQLQLEHLRTHPQVFAQLQAGALTLHGWVYDIPSGDVEVLDPLTGWAPFAQAYSGFLARPAASLPEVRHA